MNPRRVHQLFQHNFPPFSAAALDWAIFYRGLNATTEDVARFLSSNFEEPSLLYEVTRKIAGEAPIPELAQAITPFVGTFQVLVADREFAKVAVIASAGVAVAWRPAETPRLAQASTAATQHGQNKVNVA